MRPNRMASLKEKLRHGSDNFDFGALLEGVSTIEEESTEEELVVQTTIAESSHDSSIEDALPGNLQLEIPVVEPVRDHLRTALESLSCELSRELGGLRAAFMSQSIEEGGQRLAQAYRVLDLIQTLDPDGEVSRSLGISGAPPVGYAWPQTAWSFAEFAESPLSGLLPADAHDRFVRELLYEAWGVRFDTPPPV